ncbi:MAG: hypothetical protein BZ136_02430 [Methanosphaera sp. rholeuAM74]|nr:MAG: hypothetical protein BZ136_02430 [Methanosphaera sp. rholeuAM74]
MFWNNLDDEYTIIEDVPIQKLVEYAESESLPLDADSISSRWLLYSYHKARHIDVESYLHDSKPHKSHGLNRPESLSFAKNISYIMTNDDLQVNSSSFMKEDKISREVSKIFESVNGDLDEVEQKRNFFNMVLNFYVNEGENYEKRIYKHDCYIPDAEYEILERIKSQTLLPTGKQIAKLTMTCEDVKEVNSKDKRRNRVTFYLTYTEEGFFSQLCGLKDADKLINLLNS